MVGSSLIRKKEKLAEISTGFHSLSLAVNRCTIRCDLLLLVDIRCHWLCHSSKAATGGALLKKVFLEISQNSQENTYARVSFCADLFYRTPLGECFRLVVTC